MIHELGIVNINEVQGLYKLDRNEMLKKVKTTRGVSIRQLSRITGISKSIIEKL